MHPDLRTKKAESFSPQLLQGFWFKAQEKDKIVVMSPTVFTQNSKQKEVIWLQYGLCLPVAVYQILGGKHFFILGPESGKIFWLKKVQYLQKKVPLLMDPPSWQETEVDFFHNFWQALTTT